MLGKILGAIAGPVLGLLGNKENRDAQADANQANYQAQKEFAQKGIQWRAQDAKAAGLHPMAALGASGSSFSPSFQAFNSGVDYQGIADAIPGQNTQRAARAGMTDQERELHALAVRRGQLENQLLEGQITQLWSSIMGQPSNPPAPGPSVAGAQSATGQQGRLQIVPSRQESSRKGDSGVTAGASPAMRPVDIANGRQVELINPDIAESLEGYGILQAPLAAGIHAYRGMARLADRMRPPSADLLPPTHRWSWSLSSGSWVPVRKPESKSSSRRRDTPAAAARARFQGGASGSW